ncbi:MAG: 2-oxoglutarate dehydrogenase E1 component [Proteobacteria bacterium]|nr:MAG: 2-oxoglutarate dehydrogenase E1 component [Pseudomonadota bacterium]
MQGTVDGGKFSFASGTNINFLEDLYTEYQKNPDAVDPSMKAFFEGYEFATSSGKKFAKGAAPASAGTSGTSTDGIEAKVEDYINLFRRLGHLSADLNPLKEKPNLDEMFKPENSGLGGVDDGRTVHPASLPNKGPTSFGEVRSIVAETYTSKIGADFRDTTDNEAIQWLQNQMESCKNKPQHSKELKKYSLGKLMRAETFERFLQDRYLGQKRFSIEGLDSMILLLDVLADESVKNNAEEIILGMAHRGRLNVLANFMGKSYEQMIKEFEGSEIEAYGIDGDVKYHKGFASTIGTFSGGKIRAYLSPNPSHLEAVNPVVEGFARARQRMLGDSKDRARVLPMLIHGDAAFMGQGLVAETLNLSELDSYQTGGTIHIISNNQVGFTTDPEEGRSSRYASNMAKIIRAPVLHVNADDPEAVIWVAQLAVAYRQKFKCDIVIDLIGYRRHGHNETDEPSFTQPLMYKKIKAHPTVLTLYGERLVKEGLVTADEVAKQVKEFRDHLQECMEKVRAGVVNIVSQVPKELEGAMKFVKATPEDYFKPVKTTIDNATMKKIVERITYIPAGFSPNSKIDRLLKTRQEMISGEGAIDWGLGELLAYGSLGLEGKHVRLSGQDCQRGTFSHRHAVIRDSETGEKLHLLNQIDPKQASVEVINSPLSEQGVMGFEFGYTVADPESLVLWEGQFGDFVNGAQIIIDQFLVASEAKWKQNSGLVLLLPHGHEGGGPEHSSGRPERFLQLCGDYNIQVANVTKPAQFFHILRRQLARPFRKPLVIMTPKSLLRHPACVSKIEEFTKGGFQEVIDDLSVSKKAEAKRVVMCSGKIFYELEKERQELANKEQIAIVRLEQLYPFPEEEVQKILKNYSGADEILWVQEEPSNMGSWTFMRHRLEAIASGRKVAYCGRRDAGTTAEGSMKVHEKEQKRILLEALTLPEKAAKRAKQS